MGKLMRLLILFGTLLTIRAEGEMTVPEFPLPDVRKLLAEVLPPRRKAPETRELIAKAADSRRNMYDEWRNRLFLADDPKDVALFRSLLDSPNPLFRAAACLYVARVRDAQSWGKVLSRSGDPDAMVRRYAAEALGEFRRIQALPKLATLLNDPDSLVQGCVPSAAGKILRAHPPEQVLERVGAPDSKLTGPLLARLLDSLVGRREPSCVPLLIELLGERHSLPQDFSPEKALRRFAGPIHSAAREKLRETWHDWWERTALDAGPDEARKPQQSWHGCSLVIAPPQQDVLSPEVTIKHQFRTESDWYPFVVPVKDEGLPGYLQYVIFADGREVERGETSDRMKLPPGSMVRYWSEAYGSRAAIWAARWPTDRFEPKVGPGTYEVQLEARYLCTERVADNFGDMGTFAMGPTVSVGEVFTLKSNRRRLVLRPRTEKLSAASLARLAEALAAPPKGKPRAVEVKLVDIKEGSTSSPRAVSLRGRRSCLRALRGAGEAGLEAVLKSFDPGSATSTQLYYLEGVDSDLAMAALLRAAAAGRWSTPEDRKNKLLEEATAEVGSERWRWHRSRQALQYLDGLVGTDDRGFVEALCRELDDRLEGKRDGAARQDGESVWGAFRTAFFLGCIGDPRAIPVLKRAALAQDSSRFPGRILSVLLRWHALVALKLIQVSNLPEAQRRKEARIWLEHCFSSPEEHFMSRFRLLPRLGQFLGADRQNVCRELRKTVPAPWMIHDLNVLVSQ